MTIKIWTAAIIRVLVQDGAGDRADQVREAAPIVFRLSAKYGVDPLTVGAVVLAESGFRREAVSRAGAVGWIQILPGGSAARGYETLTPQQLADPTINLTLGIKHLARCRIQCGPDQRAWLGQYNGLACRQAGGRYATRVLVWEARLLGEIQKMRRLPLPPLVQHANP